MAFAFDKSVVNEVELFQTAPMTIDDFTYARDNALPFGGSTSSVPEPASWLLLLSASACGVAARYRSKGAAPGSRELCSAVRAAKDSGQIFHPSICGLASTVTSRPCLRITSEVAGRWRRPSLLRGTLVRQARASSLLSSHW